MVKICPVTELRGLEVALRSLRCTLEEQQMRIILAIALSALTICAQSNAATIIGATSATINNDALGFGNIADTYNQSGLSNSYTSGVTNFTSYISGDPTHTVGFQGSEWFSAIGSSASVTYDLGSVIGIRSLALWNEESSGIGMLSLFQSSDGVSFSSIGSFSPTDNPFDVSYGAQVFDFSPTAARYVRFDMSGCPQEPSGFGSCAIGEVAFQSAQVASVPETATWGMMLFGFAAVGSAMRRRKRASTLNPV